MSYKLCRFSPMLRGLIGGVVLLSSSGVYAGSGETLHNPAASAVDATQTSSKFQHSLISYPETGLNSAKPIVWANEYVERSSENPAIEEEPGSDLLQRKSSTVETGIGMGVTPLFDSYGVYRTSSDDKQSTYVVLGFIADELAMDEMGEAESAENMSDSGLSYGFGVNKSSFNFEYMMSMDEQSQQVSAVGLRFTSEF